MDDHLFSLIHTGSFRQLQLVLECGCDVNCRNVRQETPLMAAMISIHNPDRRQAEIQLLLHYGADINCRNLRGQTPLMYACVLNQIGSLEILLKSKLLDCNMQDFEGNTALMYASALGNLEAAKVLVDAHNNKQVDLDLNVTNHEGATALLLARDCEYDDIVQVLATLTRDKNIKDVVCEEKRNVETGEQKPNLGIKQLAGTIEYLHEQKTPEDSEAKETSETAIKQQTHFCGSNFYHNKNIEDQKDPTEPKHREGKAVLDVHIPQTKDDCVEKLLDIAEKSHDAITNILNTTELNINDTSFFNSQSIPVSKKAKRKRKRKKQKDQEINDSIELPLFGKQDWLQNAVSGEFAIGNQIYPIPTCSSHKLGEDEMKVIRSTVKDHVKRELYKTLNISPESSQPFVEIDTGKLDYLNLDAREKAKLLGRTVWSVYGAPLPPIPLDDETVQHVIEEITDVRKYLGRAKFQDGRLANLDPELWCIIESIRTEIQPD